MSCLKSKGHSVDIQVLGNKARAEYRCTIIEDRKCTLQIVPSDVHCRNIDEQTIHNFKTYLLSIPAGVSDSFHNFLWDQLLPQTELTFNLLC